MKRPRLAMAGGSGWCSIPVELLEQIAGRLSTDADVSHIHQVCAHWRACTSPPAAFRPWIVARRTAWSRLSRPDNYSVWLPLRLLQRKVEEAGAPAGLPYCRGTSHGWLALVDGARSPAQSRLVLWDPASGTEIPLPLLSRVIQVFLSGDPLDSPGWMAVASQRLGECAAKSFFWRPGDAAWSALSDVPTAGIVSAAFHGGKVYHMDLRRIVFAYDLNLGTARPPTRIWVRNVGATVDRSCRCDLFHAVREAHLVTCAGELLLVVLRRDPGVRRANLRRPGPSSSGPSFCSSFAVVYKPDWSPEGELELGERVTDLGEHSLFLGRGESFALSAKEFPAIKRNHIYCVASHWGYSPKGDCRLQPEWAFTFDLGSDTLKEIRYPEELRDEGTNWWPHSWLCLRSPLMKKQQQ